MVSQDRWPLVAGSMQWQVGSVTLAGSITLNRSPIALKHGTYHEYVDFKDRWSPMAMVSRNRFHRTTAQSTEEAVND